MNVWICILFCVTIQYFRFQNYLLVLHDVPGSHCIFPASASDSTISLRIRGSFFWRIFREDLGSHVLTVTRVSLLFVPLRTELGRTHSRIYISFYMSAHMLKIGIPPTPKKTRFILAYSFICNCLPNSKESRFYYV